MQRLKLTLATPAENVALDEALLDWTEDDAPLLEILRIWEPPEPMVVVGRSSRVGLELDVDACRQRGIPILRRSSGGAAIVAGPGCLMYAVVLSYRIRPELRDIGRAHRFVLGRLANALRPMLSPSNVAHTGTSDLAVMCATGSASACASGQDKHWQSQWHPSAPPRKFSGNSLRAKRTHLLYHGTLLYNFDLPVVSTLLKMPPRQPEYRAERPHRDFLTNLPLARAELIQAVDRAWPTSGPLLRVPQSRVDHLVAERFSRDEWTFEFP